MKSKKKIILCLILVVTMVFSVTSTTLAKDLDINEEKTITEAYEYPIRPGTKEWREFESRIEKIDACTIPDSILSKMTTEALLETVMDYPLLVDMVVRNTKQKGFDAILRVFNGLQELVKRADVLLVLEEYQNKLFAIENKDMNTLCKVQYLEYMFIGIDPEIEELAMRASMGTVYTPEGTAVSTYYNATWADHQTTAYYANINDNNLQAAYPNAVRLRQEVPYYNCHSYAWYSDSTSNRHWINIPSAYMNDGSYTSGGAVVGSKVYYGSTADHSGIVTGVGGGSGPNVGVRSKWGPGGTYSHNIVDCPYTDGTYSCTFWN